MGKARAIELLAPAKDLATGREAILHGADAVYIGAPRFGARASAGVSLEDLQQLSTFAHAYGVKIYVALNTILYDQELEEAEALIWDIYRTGVDALIIQDMGILEMNLPPLPLHASTQCDTTTPEEAIQLEALGFEQIVLARELNLEQIRQISTEVHTPLEVFVHGALCVSYSGRCYISQAFTGRSANRGNCSQQCRLPYTLSDARGRIIRQDEHLLSPKDLNRSKILGELLEAGVSSFKIEGRLKGISYVKNIVAYYRQALDKLIEANPEKYYRASFGHSKISFIPQANKSFNRGFTSYQLEHKHKGMTERIPSLINPHSPKSQGEYLAQLEKSKGTVWRLSSEARAKLNNGDGLCYITPQGESGGIRINKVNPDGTFSLARPLNLPKGSEIFRNYDIEFERKLAGNTATRLWDIKVRLRATSWGFALDLSPIDLPRLEITASLELPIERAKRFDKQRIEKELNKFGDSIFRASVIELDFGGRELFIPLSRLGELRRKASEQLLKAITMHFSNREHNSKKKKKDKAKALKQSLDYRANIANHLAEKHYQSLGYKTLEKAYELKPVKDAKLMTTKHCLRYEIGYCHRVDGAKQMPYQEPLYLEREGQRIRLDFDCKNCQMLLYKE